MHCANASRLKDYGHYPCNVKPSVPGSGSTGGLFIYVSIQSSILLASTMCKLLCWVQVFKKNQVNSCLFKKHIEEKERHIIDTSGPHRTCDTAS